MNRTSRIDEFPINLCKYWQKDRRLSSRKNASNAYILGKPFCPDLSKGRLIFSSLTLSSKRPKAVWNKEIKIAEYLLCRFHACWSSWRCWSDRWTPPFRPTVPEKRPTPQVSWEAEGTWGSHGYQLPSRNSLEGLFCQDQWPALDQPAIETVLENCTNIE